MNKYFSIMVLPYLLAVQAASASNTVVCTEQKNGNAAISAKFVRYSETDTRVNLSVPFGDVFGERFSGTCSRVQGAIEFALTCGLMTSTDSGYTVELFSTGGTKLSASVTTWSMLGRGKPIFLQCP